MEDEQEFHEDDPSPFDFMEEDKDDREAAEGEAGEEAEPFNHNFGVSHEAKLRELLRNLCSLEVEIYSEASKEFASMLRGDSGGELLRLYIQSSPKCSELVEAWRMRQGKPGITHIFSLVSAVLDHPQGRSRASGISRNIDDFSRTIIGQKMEDIYTELKSEEFKRQNAVLRLLACIVRRGMGLASEVAKNFDFKLPVLSKLSGNRKIKGGKDGKKHHGRHSTRRSFIEFAMSFLEVGNPRLLRWILQQRDVYYGVLRGLGSDDTETLVHVLSTLRDKVLTADSLVPPGLRSVLFGSVTLEQLSIVSGNPMGGPAADLAHEVMVLVCTDPRNGLMPDNSLKGNRMRLLELMKKLKATEVRHHKDLLLAIVKGRPSLCSLYMDVFPYSLEPYSSPLWFSAISLAADLISSASSSPKLTLVATSLSSDPPNLDSHEVQCILKCIVPRSFTRPVSNKGLLHYDILVKHGSLRLLLEMLKSLHNLFIAIDGAVDSMNLNQAVDASKKVLADLNDLPGSSCFSIIDNCLHSERVAASHSDQSTVRKWLCLKEDIQDEIRAKLPDPQVLLKLLSSLNFNSSEGSKASLKRCAGLPNSGRKRLKSDMNPIDENIDIVVSGIVSGPNNDQSQESKKTEVSEEMDLEDTYITTAVDEIWGLCKPDVTTNESKDVDILFHTKLLDALAFYLRTTPTALEGSFDFFKILPSDPSSLSTCHKQSLLLLLVEYVGQSPGSNDSIRTREMMYKHLQPLINIMMHSRKEIKRQAYLLARSAMLSTGAFDHNISEIDAWFLFIPGYSRDEYCLETEVDKVFGKLAAVVISFFCDAVSTVGNNLYRYMYDMLAFVSKLEGAGDTPPCFSTLVICILQKCLRLLESDSGTFKVSDKTMISLYVSNTLTFLMQIQVNSRILPGLVDLLLSEKFKEPVSVDGDPKSSLCEWRPLKNLLTFARSILHQQTCSNLLSISERSMKKNDDSLYKVLNKVKHFLENKLDSGLAGVAISLSSAVTCASPDDILGCFPLLVVVARHLFGAYPQCLSSVLFLEWQFLAGIANLWPDMFFPAVDIVGATVINNRLEFEESAAAAFSFYLKHAPFYSIIASTINFCSCNESASAKMLNLLQAKLSESGVEDSILSLRILLFWAHQIRLSYKAKPSDNLERLFQMCFALIEHTVKHLLTVNSVTANLETIGAPCQGKYICEVAELIFTHPVVILSLSNPLCFSGTLFEATSCDSFDNFLILSKQSVHPMDHLVLHLLNKVADSLIAMEDVHNSASRMVSVPESLIKAFKNIIQQSVNYFKENFNLCVLMKDLVPILPSFYIFYALMHFISPFELLELVGWMLSKVDDELIGWMSPRVSALSVALYMADNAFKMFCSILQQQHLDRVHVLFWEMTGRTYTSCHLQNVYCKILELSICFRLDYADVCLLKAVSAAYIQRFARTTSTLLPFSMLMLRTVLRNPIKILAHCIYNTSKTKAKILFKLTEISPLHSRLFGLTFMGIISKDFYAVNLGNSWPLKGGMTREVCDYVFSNEDLLLMLPAALSFLTTNLVKLRRHDSEFYGIIPSFYSGILLDGFSNWKEYVSTSIFHEECDEPISTPEEFQFVFSSTLLGKSIRMLHHHFILNPNSVTKKQQLKIFESIYGSDEVLLDCDIMEIKEESYGESFNLINRVFAKLSLTWLLLFPPENLVRLLPKKVDEDSKGASTRKESKSDRSAKVRFMNILVGTLDKIVRKTSFKHDYCKKSNKAGCFQLLQFLEESLLKNILQLAIKIQSSVIKLRSIPFLESFIKSSLLHKFEDASTLIAIHQLLVTLKGGFSASEMLELLLGHSKFVPVIIWGISSSDSGNAGTFLQPVQSVFKLIDSSPVRDGSHLRDAAFELKNRESTIDKKKLELVKLLRFLYNLAVQQHITCSGGVLSMNTSELVSLLLSGYGASMSEIDMEIFHLIQDIESAEQSSFRSIADMDYLWGNSALKIRKEQTVDKLVSDSEATDCESTQERSRRLFRENILIDSKKCAITVLNFCYEKTRLTTTISEKEPWQCDLMDTAKQTRHEKVDSSQLYDPAFILRFSIHSLLKGYIEPMEFAQLGLLAIAFVSISSADDDLRTLGYEALGCFQKVLANHRKSKDVLQLQLLLTYLQNGITEPWERIPSISAIFAAEASFALLDTSQGHFQTISKFLMRSPRIDLKDLPLFHTFFESGSIHFKTERMWILRLIYAGLNLDDDAQIITRKFVIERLLSFYSSSLSDSETKTLILQIVKKSIKLRNLACRLVKDCGLICWLHSVILSNLERIYGDQKDFPFKELEMVLEVILDVVSLRPITEWLKTDALEQLSNVSSSLLGLLVCSLKKLNGNILLVNSIFHLIASTLKISQKRKVFQPHFTLSIESIFRLYKAINKELCHTRFSHTIELLGLRTLLMSTPPPVKFQMDKAKLSKVFLWAIPSALQSHSRQVFSCKEPDLGFLKSVGDQESEESLVVKLLRWVTASVILGCISSRYSRRDVSLEREKVDNLQSFLENIRKGQEESTESREDFSTNEALAVTILYLQQLLGKNSAVLPSVILSLSLLLLSDTHTAVRELCAEDNSSYMASLFLKIHCPAEVNPLWRWSFYEPWKDHSLEQTSIQCLEEEHACQTILLIFSNSLLGESSGLQVLSHRDLELCGLFAWERNIVLGSA